MIRTMASGKKILIFNYDFPPNSGIGGRRWAKFARQLAMDGYIVHVIKADAVFGEDQSYWSEDVKHPNIIVHSLPRAYPVLFSHPKKDIWSRIMYRWYRRKLERSEKGTIYDISIGWGQRLCDLATTLISEEKIKNICATGAPWRMLYDVATLKEKHQDLRLIIDYRDPWLNARNYGMPGLDGSRRKEEERKQTHILQHADVVITPYQYLTEELHEYSSQQGGPQPQFEVVTHCYDPSDIVRLENKKTSGIRIVYGGDLYTGIHRELQLLSRALQKIREQDLATFESIDLRIFTNKHEDRTLSDLSCVKIMAGIGKKIFQELSDADASLIILPVHKKDDRTTKFFEIMACRKPFIVISEEGEVTKFVRDNHLGYILNREGSNLAEIIDAIRHGSSSFDSSFPIEQYSLPAVTTQLKKFFV
ncbi:MAG: hypothetical protein K1X54_05600 [Flavobacteriales bacterium]|nr:hypothetical protein [Flavobacteriales bacterium]